MSSTISPVADSGQRMILRALREPLFRLPFVKGFGFAGEVGFFMVHVEKDDEGVRERIRAVLSGERVRSANADYFVNYVTRRPKVFPKVRLWEDRAP
jgi:hypothetical protein